MATPIEGPALPTPYVRQIVELANSWGISESKLLNDSGISPALVQKRDARIPINQFAALVMNLLRLSQRPGIGFDLGLHLTLTSHGKLGIAAMSASTLRAAAHIALTYVQKVWGAFSLELHEQGDISELRLRDHISLGPMNQVAQEVMLSLLWRHACQITGQSRAEVELCLPWSEPTYFADYAKRLPKVCWNAPHASLRFPSIFLDYPLQMADPPASQHALTEAEQELAAVSTTPESFVYKVQRELKANADGFPSLSKVAARLHTSERSLKRKLHMAGSSFREQLQLAMRAEAERLMLNPDLHLQDISLRLGYENPASFSKAFKRWSGQTPGQFRQALISSN